MSAIDEQGRARQAGGGLRGLRVRKFKAIPASISPCAALSWRRIATRNACHRV